MKKLIITLCILTIIIVLLLVAYNLFIVKIKLETDVLDVKSIEVHTPGVKKDIYTKDENEILQVIKAIEGIRYYKGKDFVIYSETPDAYIALFDKDGKVIEEIEYFGDVAVHKKNMYRMIPFTYLRLEKLCNMMNKSK